MEPKVCLRLTYLCDFMRGVYTSDHMAGWIHSWAKYLFVEGNDLKAPTECPTILYPLLFLFLIFRLPMGLEITSWTSSTVRFCKFWKRRPFGYGCYRHIHLILVTFNWKPISSANFEKERLGFGGYRHVHLISVPINWEPKGSANCEKSPSGGRWLQTCLLDTSNVKLRTKRFC